MWEEALLDAARNYRAANETISNVEESQARYELKRDNKGNTYWQIETEKDIFKGITSENELQRKAFDFLIDSRDRKTVIHTIDGKQMSFIRLSAEEFTMSVESQDLKKNSPEIFKQKMRMIPSLEDLTLNAKVNWQSPDHKNHRLFHENGFENYRGKVRIDNVIFNYIVRAGKAGFGDVFYDINLEVDQFLPHAKSASEITRPTSTIDSISDSAEKSSEKIEAGDATRNYRAANETAAKATESLTQRAQTALAEAEKDPTAVMREDVRIMFEGAKARAFKDSTYLPVRINTPDLLMESARRMDVEMKDLPAAMSVYKVRQALENEETWDGDSKDRPHGLTEEELLSIIEKMDSPDYIVYQEENGRFSEIVTFDREGKGKIRKAFAIVDYFGSETNSKSKNPDIMNGYSGGEYNIVVTLFAPDSQADINNYLDKGTHETIYNKEKGFLRGSTDGNASSLSNKSPFAISISNSAEKSSEKIEAGDATRNYRAANETAAESGERNQISKDFDKQIKAWDKNTIGFSFVVGTTSEALQSAGIGKNKSGGMPRRLKTH